MAWESVSVLAVLMHCEQDPNGAWSTGEEAKLFTLAALLEWQQSSVLILQLKSRVVRGSKVMHCLSPHQHIVICFPELDD